MIRNKLVIMLGMGFNAIICGTVLFVIFILINNIFSKDKKKISRRILEWAYIVYIVMVLNITGITMIQDLKLEWFKASLTDLGLSVPRDYASLIMIVFNVIMFIPFGLLTPMLSKKMKPGVVMVLAIIFTLSIELLQGFSGRFVELNDVLANSFGGGIGLLLYVVVKKKKGIEWKK